MPRKAPKSNYYRVDDVMAIMEVSKTKAYDVILELNRELRERGIYTIPGRVTKSYFHLRTDVNIAEVGAKGGAA
ncbi:MAG: hypothetical protein FWE08_03585 [Oscillospiraceae bacterium]|nr:hypothetical protein [Oscillospiraceae bacterium]